MKKIAVLGCGLMGSGISQISAAAQFEVTCIENSQEALDRGKQSIEKSLSRFVKKGKIAEEDQKAILGRLTFSLDLQDCKDSDLIIEAIVEDIAEKQKIFEQLDSLCGPETIFATNTSSLTVVEMASVTKRPEQFIGLHFFNPVPLMKLVEVVRTISTSEKTFQACWEFSKKIGKEPIECKDHSGFVVNLLLVPYLLDAIRALESHVASIEDIDKGMRLGAGHPMGPLTLLDFVGLDTTYKIAEIMFKEYREKRYAPPPLLKKMVLAGYYGKKNGKGFYDYTGDQVTVNSLHF